MAADSEQAREAESKAKIFISYSRKDMAFADKLEAALKTRGFEVLIDREEIYAFEDWWKRIQTLIGQADTIVFVLSPDAVKSDVALKEVTHAAFLNKRFAPIVWQRVEDSAVPEALRRLNFIFFDDPAQFEASADRLAVALQTDIVWIRRHTEFGEASRRWIEGCRAEGLLLRSPALEEAERWIASRPVTAPLPTAEMLAFVAESRRAMIWRRRRAIVLASIVGFLMVAILTAWWRQDWLGERIYVWRNVKVITASQTRALQPKDSFKECTDCSEMVVVPAGSFMMGSAEGQGEKDEHPQHKVTVAKPFAIAKFELTFAEWDACVAAGGCSGYKPWDNSWGRGRQPVINVSWNDAKQYVDWLAQLTGKPYRLPTEAEYEYATRAGTTTAFPWGDDIKLNGQAMAQCAGCGSQWYAKQTRAAPTGPLTAPVGSFPPNKFGLYDMVGNVSEWTEDCYHDSYNAAPTNGSAWIAGGDCGSRVWRGGARDRLIQDLRSAYRYAYGSEGRSFSLGFRVARTLAP